MQAAAKTTLASLVEEHLTSLVREAVCVQRHAKRARYHPTSEESGVIRRRLHAEDVNLALQWRGSERLYATTTVVPTAEDSKTMVDLNAYLKTESQLHPPSEVGLSVHWLAVDGVQPHIPQNPNPSNSVYHLVDDDEEDDVHTVDQQQGVRVRQLLPRLLSEELQLYFTRITVAIEKGGATPADRQQQDDALARVARDAGLQELVPFFMQYLAKQLHLNIGQPDHCRTLIRLTGSLLQNPHAHLELHLHQLLPAILTTIVAKNLASNKLDNHWALRIEAAFVLWKACELFGEKYPSLRATVLKKLCEALEEDRPLTTKFGGLVGISLFGARPVDAFVLPRVQQCWAKWSAALEQTKDLENRLEIFQCQQALLDSVGVYLRGSLESDMGEQVSLEDLEESFGERLVPLHHECTDYRMSFI